MRKPIDDESYFKALQKAAGVQLTEVEERYLHWLARYDMETVETFVGLFEKIKKN